MERQKMLSLLNTDFLKSNFCDYNNVYILVIVGATIDDVENRIFQLFLYHNLISKCLKL